MITNDFLLTFELDSHKTANTIDIHLDDKGLELLLDSLLSLQNKKNNHLHFVSIEWGGNELSDKVQKEGCELIHKVTVHKW